MPSVFVHIVSFNSETYLKRCLEALLEQSGFEAGHDLTIEVTDNASSDGSRAVVASFAGVAINANSKNLGFCGAHNQGAASFLRTSCDLLLILNPDVRLAPDAVAQMVEGFNHSSLVGITCPKLLRADKNLSPLDPHTIDSTGMILTNELRHFDRGAGELDSGQYDRPSLVFGASGACMLLKRECVESLALPTSAPDRSLFALFPQLEEGFADRHQLFDEAFFAYREDAEVALRAQRLGWHCMYVPSSLGYHVRRVVPERRGQLPAEINRWGVRNRFLLQLNHVRWNEYPTLRWRGLVWRNLTVIAAVILWEWSSWPAFRDVAVLWRRAAERYRVLCEHAQVSAKEVADSFSPKSEGLL